MAMTCWFRLGAGFLFAASVAVSGARAEPAAQGAKPSPPVVVKSLRYDMQVDKAGLATETVHVQLVPTNSAAAQQIMQQPIPYSESMADLDVVEAFTVKPDGHKLAVSPSAIFAQPVPGSPQLPMFNDQRQKVIVFPDVEAGDTLDFTYRYRETRSFLPNAFTHNMKFSRLIPYNDVVVILTAPKELPLVVENHEIDFTKSAEGPNVTYRWHYAAPKPESEDTSILAPFDRSPRFLVSSYPDYDAFARAYAALVTPAVTISPAIQAKADEITAGASDRREKARKIYEWVSRHIRYLAVEVGTGAIVPHDADQVLANGYGDCKDHVALFSALLKAKGIQSEFVLIDSASSYTIPDTAIIGAFDHVIAYLPELDLYADTTAGVAPFGTLPFAEYGKPVLRITASGPARARTPILTAEAATVSIKTTARIESDGRIVGQSVATATGPFSTALRGIALAIQAVGPEHAAANALQAEHEPGEGNFIIAPPDEPGASYALTSTFNMGPVPDILSGRRFEMPGPLPVTSMPGDFLMGPLFNTKIKDSDPTPCYSGHEEEDVTLTAPKGRHFLTAPPDEDIRTANLTYTTHWTVTQDTMTLHRDFASHVDAALCEGPMRKETAEKLLAIRKSYLYGGALSPELTEEQSQLLSKLQAARDADKRGDRDGALRNYSEVIAAGKVPADTNAILVARLGRAAIYIHQQKYDEGIDEYSEVVKLNPQMGRSFTTLAQILTDHRDFARAERVWTIAISGTPGGADLYDKRGVVRDDLGRHGEAQGDFAKAISIGGTPQTVARFYADRGSSHWTAREPAAAIRDYDEAIAHDGTVAGSFEGRGLVEWANGALAAAHADFEKAAKLDPKDMYYALWLFIVDARQGKDAKAALRTRSEGWNMAQWPGPLVKVARGDLAADAIVMPSHNEPFERARDSCERDFYLAELALAGGDKERALGLFRGTVATAITEYLEYTAAGFEIDRLSDKS
ncbi:MAG TPA: DUF3857 domain-containing protein [Rhizomicrobium sp.]|nr:DUF3857 domain-containing protein [Rhizomicrobium sp.]